MVPAVVLGTHTMGLGVIRSLGKMGVPIVAVHYDNKDMGYTSKYVFEKISAPHPEKHADDFLDLLCQIANSYEGAFLLPLSDFTLTFVSKRLASLKQHFIVAAPEWEITSKIIDKKRTHAIADSLGIPAPKTISVTSMNDLERHAQEILFPCLIKPSQSHCYVAIFNRKMLIVDDYQQMWDASQEALDADLEVMIQEIIPGDDSEGANYNSYFWNGKPLVEFTAQQIRNAPHHYGSPSVVLSKNIPEVIEPGRKILQAIGFFGYACTEFKRDPRDGVYKLMEVNGRHNLSTLLAVDAGINFPWIHYQHLVEGIVPSRQRFQENVYWIDVLRDLASSYEHLKSTEKSLIQYLRPYFKPHIFAILDFKDLKPFLSRLKNLLRRAVSSVLRRGEMVKHQKG